MVLVGLYDAYGDKVLNHLLINVPICIRIAFKGIVNKVIIVSCLIVRICSLKIIMPTIRAPHSYTPPSVILFVLLLYFVFTFGIRS